jgi:hypothetical protein
VKLKKNSMNVTVRLKGWEVDAVKDAADYLTDGCVCSLISGIFWEGFKELTEHVEKQAMKEKETTA